MQSLRAINGEPIPGYRLLEPLGKGGFGEVWKCEAPGGLFKALKFVHGSNGLDANDGAEQELRALQHIKSIRHPFLLSIERVEVIGDDLVIVMELADRSLHDLLQEHRQAGRPGVPRDELLAYLREAAEVLDLLNQEHGLQHLDVKPRNLFVVGKHVKVADFGLVNSLADLYGGAAELAGAITPQYAAPEAFEGRVSLFSDQYSLAVTYHELLTGELPLQGKNFRQILLQASTGQHDLSRLSEADRAIVARALQQNPRERFESCLALIEALELAQPPSGSRALRARTTSFEMDLGDQDSTAVVEATQNSSGPLRRRSRVMPAVPPSGTATPRSGEQVLSEYQLLECLDRGRAGGELWRAQGPRGEPRLVRFLSLPEFPAGEDPLGRLLALRHPALAAVRRVEVGPGRVALLSESGESSLAHRLKECQATGQPGLPRDELLGHLGRLAEALDQLYHVHQLQHLALSPRMVALSRGEIVLQEFGLAELLWLPLGQPPASLSPRYAAVELFDGLVSDACDQYSLALMYQELLVGLHPFRNLNARQMATPKMRGQPDLSLLPAPDREVVKRALSVEPEKRYRSCREFVLALEESNWQGETAPVLPSLGATQVIERPAPVAPPPWQQPLEELVKGASNRQEVRSEGGLYYRLQPGREIEQHGWARLASGMGRLKITSFREQWQAEVLARAENRWLLAVRTPAGRVQRWLGRKPGLLVEVVLGSPRESMGQMTPVRVRLEPLECGRGKGEQVLTELGPTLLSSLATYLSSQADRAAQERYPLAQPVHVQSKTGGLSVSCKLKNIGREALALVSPSLLPAGAVTLTLTRWGSLETFRVPGWVRDCLPGEDKKFEVEVGLG